MASCGTEDGEMNDGRHGSARYVTTGMMALIGAVFFFAFLLEDVVGRSSVVWADLPWAVILRYVVAMVIGGALAGWLLAGSFGRRGVAGWLLALLGGALATTIAGLLGSAFGLLPDLLADGWEMADLIPIGYGLAVLPLAFAGVPLLSLAWLVLVALTHVLAKRARAVAPRSA
jgi:hypothetical protein